MADIQSDIWSLSVIVLTISLHLVLKLSTFTLLMTVLMLVVASNLHRLVRFSMRSERVRRLVHRHIAWDLVNFRIKFLQGYSWYSEIDSTVILGALPIPENIPSLQRARVRLIITLCEPFELEFIYTEQEFTNMGFINKRYSVPDAFGAPEMDHLVEILQNISEMERKGYRTYVHCKAGRGRSASTVLCYLIFRYNVSVEWALSLLKKQRFEVSPKPQQLTRAREFRDIFPNIAALKHVTFSSTNCELLEGARFKFALRHITSKRSSVPNCNTIVNYRRRFTLRRSQTETLLTNNEETLEEEEEEEEEKEEVIIEEVKTRRRSRRRGVYQIPHEI